MSNKMNILLIEDDIELAGGVVDLLGMDGHNVTHAPTYEEAERLVTDVIGGVAVCHAVISDFWLDEPATTNTMPLLVALSSERPDVPIIGFSSKPMPDNGVSSEILFADPGKDGFIDLPDIVGGIRPTSA
jgi:DNA-binding NtrC family response regulator